MAFGDPSKSERGHLQRDAFAPCGKSLNEGHGFSRAAEYAIGEGYLAAASINPCVRTRKEAADLTIPSLVGAPCFSRGELDLSPAETGFISQEWALALAGAKAYDQPRTLSRDAEALSKLAGEMGVGLFNLLKRFESSQSEQKRVAKSSQDMHLRLYQQLRFRPRERNRRSLHCAPPDFLWRVVALAEFMRLSLRKAAYGVVDECRVVGNPGTLRSHRQAG